MVGSFEFADAALHHDFMSSSSGRVMAFEFINDCSSEPTLSMDSAEDRLDILEPEQEYSDCLESEPTSSSSGHDSLSSPALLPEHDLPTAAEVCDIDLLQVQGSEADVGRDGGVSPLTGGMSSWVPGQNTGEWLGALTSIAQQSQVLIANVVESCKQLPLESLRILRGNLLNTHSRESLATQIGARLLGLPARTVRSITSFSPRGF